MAGVEMRRRKKINGPLSSITAEPDRGARAPRSAYTAAGRELRARSQAAPQPERSEQFVASALASGSATQWQARRPAKPVLVLHAVEHLKRLVQLVRDHRWAPKSRELQILLGVKEDPFLRIVDLPWRRGGFGARGRSPA